MDISSLMTTLLSDESVQSVGKKTGVSNDMVESVLENALPMLLKGAKEQANGKETAESFAGALLQHAKTDTSDLGAFMDGVDLEDGAKIIAHLLGAETADKKKTVAKKAGASAASTDTILSMAGPLLMSLLGQQAEQEEEKEDVGGLMGSLLQGVDIGDLAKLLLGKKKEGLGLGDIASLLGKLLK